MNWISYHDIFQTIVNDNISMTKIQTYFYVASWIGTPLIFLVNMQLQEQLTFEKTFHNERMFVNQIVSGNGTFQAIKM